MSTVGEQLNGLQTTIDTVAGMTTWDAVGLREAVQDALALPGPKGDPGALRQQADALTRTATAAGTVGEGVRQIARQGIPNAWAGAASEEARGAVVAIADDIDATHDALKAGTMALGDLADGIEQAQLHHHHGTADLQLANGLLKQITVTGPFGIVLPNMVSWDNQAMQQAMLLAQQGVRDLLSACRKAEDAGKAAAARLQDLASSAPTAHLTTDHLSASYKIILADAGVVDGLTQRDHILTGNALARASRFLDGLSPTDRGTLDDLLTKSKSVQEQAYLLKALAAGHSVKEIGQFDALIHDHGDDPNWLSSHLTPLHDSPQRLRWSQGDDPTCAALSLIVAHAMVDPVYTLQLTTGGRPDDPAFNSPDAFGNRLRDEQYRVDKENHESLLYLAQAANQEVSPYTGHDYRLHRLDDSAAQRRDALPAIVAALDDGKPVGISVPFHQMLIVGHEGDKLAIYNPAGYTTWVTENDFINGHLERTMYQSPGLALRPDGPQPIAPIPDAVLIPT